ncbi:tRNA dihydrouridine synthase [Saccharicrinis fermentans]|uniref:tRNA-dihydrouridine synthase n=1 Tax=Saccharicrinis fermentans DSM 9555 = JCM 21142 TaxID=869213 RepID=W7YBG7_9BACT|nr:tRNA-dihydrouridine synthase [Saccharicrinis fermentans]GAF04978.1 tRNA-dihydrouridine synthase [Saccharicrinis fermentans DSM 9555 = JCM 21142]
MHKNDNFWNKAKHIFALAPMEDVTDTVFRELIINESEPNRLNLVFSEFLSTDGFCHPVGRDKVLHRFKVNPSELALKNKKNIQLIAQIWGTDPEKFYQTAQYIQANTPFDGIDINMGCPQKNIIKKGACSALISHPDLAKEIIQATTEATHLPVSVKTRIGFKKVETENWISHLLQTPIRALTIHGRTQKQMSEGQADWNEIGKVVTLRDEINPHIKILGNGDVLSIEDGNHKIDEYGVDGIMVGRGIFNNFWMFSSKEDVTIEDKLRAMWNHAVLFDNTWKNEKPWVLLRRFFKIYTHHLPMAAQLRDAVMRTHNINELQAALNDYRSKLSNISS